MNLLIIRQIEECHLQITHSGSQWHRHGPRLNQLIIWMRNVCSMSTNKSKQPWPSLSTVQRSRMTWNFELGFRRSSWRLSKSWSNNAKGGAASMSRPWGQYLSILATVLFPPIERRFKNNNDLQCTKFKVCFVAKTQGKQWEKKKERRPIRCAQESWCCNLFRWYYDIPSRRMQQAHHGHRDIEHTKEFRTCIYNSCQAIYNQDLDSSFQCVCDHQ